MDNYPKQQERKLTFQGDHRNTLQQWQSLSS